jgi:DNA primase
VLQLLKYGIKNAVAGEGTDVPDAIADLTAGRTVTSFLDGDRGGDLILKELAQVGDVDYVAVTPSGKSVEDLSRSEVMSALLDKVPSDTVASAKSLDSIREEMAHAGESTTADGGAVTAAPSGDTPDSQSATDAQPGTTQAETTDGTDGTVAEETEAVAVADTNSSEETTEGDDEPTIPSLSDHIEAVIEEHSGTARLVDEDAPLLAEGDADDVVSLLESADEVPRTVVIDGDCTQKLLDVAAQRGVGVVGAAGHAEYVEQPKAAQVRIQG